MLEDTGDVGGLYFASLGHPTHGSLSEVNCPHGGILVRIEGVEFLIGP